jgi:hypothetical protein
MPDAIIVQGFWPAHFVDKFVAVGGLAVRKIGTDDAHAVDGARNDTIVLTAASKASSTSTSALTAG